MLEYKSNGSDICPMGGVKPLNKNNLKTKLNQMITEHIKTKK